MIEQSAAAAQTANMSWACQRCTLEQSDRRRACGACGNLRPDLLRACFPDVKTQKRPKATSAVGGAKGGVANPRGVWSNLPLTCTCGLVRCHGGHGPQLTLVTPIAGATAAIRKPPAVINTAVKARAMGGGAVRGISAAPPTITDGTARSQLDDAPQAQ